MGRAATVTRIPDAFLQYVLYSKVVSACTVQYINRTVVRISLTVPNLDVVRTSVQYSVLCWAFGISVTCSLGIEEYLNSGSK